MKEIIDKTDGKICFYSSILLDKKTILFFNKFESDKKREVYIFQVHPSTTYKDLREKIITITHCIDYTEHQPKEYHKLKFVLDPKNNNPTTPFHLNLSGLSKEFLFTNKCSKCKKYFFELNHLPFVFNEREEYGKYKFNNLDKTINIFFESLEKLGFFEEFVYSVNY